VAPRRSEGLRDEPSRLTLSSVTNSYVYSLSLAATTGQAVYSHPFYLCQRRIGAAATTLTKLWPE
jgi:hypothetical protein